MASHHPHPHPVAAVSSCYCHCWHPTYLPCHPHHPPPPDPYLHHPQDLPHLYSPVSHPQYAQHFQEPYIQERSQAHPTVVSLLRRIAALESALRRRSSSSHSHSLRDAAARSIQAHFRAFLVRRSKTLRLLKDLALIKSSLGFLKSSVSRKTHFDYDSVYQKAANLLLKLEAIQGADPMIRNGKSALSRELYTFLDFIGGASVQTRITEVSVKQSGDNVRSRVFNCAKKRGNAESGCSKRINVEKLKGLVERIDRLSEELQEKEQCQESENPKDELVMMKCGASPNSSGGGGGMAKQHHGGVRPKVKKNVSFAENGNVYMALRRESKPYLEECSNGSIDEDDDEEQELVDDLCRELEEIGGSLKEDVEDGGGSSNSENGEKDSTHSWRGRGELDRDDSGGFVLSPPLHEKMERRSN